RLQNPYYPFADRGEWGLGKYLCENLNRGQITRFLKLEWFKTRDKPVFKSVDELFSWTDSLPKGPRWHCTKIEMEGYVTVHPVFLLWRDAWEVTQVVFGNPVFHHHMSYDPHKVFAGTDREYGEWMSSERAYKIQDQLPTGAMIVPIILASDKTPVTQQTGNLEMHPLFLTLGNIQSDVRMKVTTHAWSCIAYMPIAQFVAHGDYASILQARLWHWCMDIVCGGLKRVAARGEFMVDPAGYLRYCFTPLVGYLADLPEQLMIACIAQSTSPLAQHVDPWKVREFQGGAKAINLSGVHLPFWRDWRFGNPVYFLTPEILHTLHKFFFDHILKWCKEGLGQDELDSRYTSQHRRVGTRHFTNRVSHIKQMTGQEHWDLQRTIVASIAGPVSSDFVHAIRALINFIYKAQAPTFTDVSITSMVESLAEFHLHKDSIISAGLRRGASGPINHFEIPKLELFHSFASAIRNIGSLIQFTADVSERLLITHCKNPFERTSHQRNTFMQQIVRVLDREETMRQFDLCALLCDHRLELTNIIDEEFDEMVDIDPTLGWILRVSPEDHTSFATNNRPIRNHFLKGIILDDAQAAAHVNIVPTQRNRSQQWVTANYRLPEFAATLHHFLCSVNRPSFTQSPLNIWISFRLQLLSRFQTRKIMPSQLIQALPPSAQMPLGKCDTVLIHPSDPNYLLPCVAQVRLVFRLSDSKNTPLTEPLKIPLLYVQFFEVTQLPDDHTRMYKVKRSYRCGPDGSVIRVGGVIPITEVTHAVELIPVYGRRHNRAATAEVSLEMYDEFYINNYSDKEWYHTISENYL
ncbi:hypothetical protein PAXRUDRAFT_136264, partial [Paxillus rubicundulus Ve08.2h10]